MIFLIKKFELISQNSLLSNKCSTTKVSINFPLAFSSISNGKVCGSNPPLPTIKLWAESPLFLKFADYNFGSMCVQRTYNEQYVALTNSNCLSFSHFYIKGTIMIYGKQTQKQNLE